MGDRIARWRGLDPVTAEHCHIRSTGRGACIRGALVAPGYGLFYRMELDDLGRVRTAVIARTDGRDLHVVSDGEGAWSDAAGAPLPHLEGCIDIDLWPSPLTNSLPIWRSNWEDGQSRVFAVAWIDGDEMTVRRDDQVYTRLAETRFRFRNQEGFECVLELDVQGLVVNYPGLFERVGPAA